MAIKIPWALLCCACVPLFMIYTKSKRMDAKELHEINMRVKYHSEYWAKGNALAHRLQERVTDSVLECPDPLRGREVHTISREEWRAAAKEAMEAKETAAFDVKGSLKRLFGVSMERR